MSKIATEVFKTKDLTLLDGTEVEARPLPIAKMRKFQRLWAGHMENLTKTIEEANANDEVSISDADLTDAQYDVFIKMCSLGLETQLKGEKSDKQFLSYLEDVLDEQTIYTILDVTGGLNLRAQAPNQTPGTTPEEDGTI